MNRLPIPLLLVLVAFSAAQDKPVPPAEAPKKFTLPEGFSATLFAGEPDVVQPIAFTFDDRGRLWVVECLSYPHWKQDGTGNDRVTMFEDTDGDGHFDVRHVVYDKGSNLSGIELGHGGIWLCSVPNLVFLPCDFNADKPSVTGKPEIKLDGWNLKDTKHNIFNSLIWGPDGWLYGCNGIQSKSFVAKPGTPMKDRKEFNCGVWRYHPIRHVFEPVCHGTTNPFGLDYDEYGEMFITNCVIHHLFHVIPGAHYDRMYGQDINPFSYGLMHSIADYIHWGGGDWTTSRGNKPEHSDAGGGHAHVGCMVYIGDNWPDEYRGSHFTLNLHGARINRDILKREGSGYKAERGKDFMFANDPWFRGIALKYGPDGGVFVSDWCDTGECHNYDKVDLTNGRIHKIVYGKVKPWKGDLSKLNFDELAKLQGHKNDWFARHARRLLLEQAETSQRAKQLVTSAVQGTQRAIPPANRTTMIRCAWIRSALGDVEGAVDLNTAGIHRRDPELQTMAFRLFMDLAARGLYSVDLAAKRLEPTNPNEILSMASGMQRLPLQDRFALAVRLLSNVDEREASDANIPLMTWYAIEPIIDSDWEQTHALLEVTRLPMIRQFITRKATSRDSGQIANLLKFAAQSNQPRISSDVLQGIIEGLNGARQIQMPKEWQTSGPTLLGSRNRAVREHAMTLAVIFGDEAAAESMKKTAADAKADSADRIAALHTLQRRNKADLLPILQQIVNEKAVRAEAIRGLAAFNDPGTSALLLKLYPNLTDAEKEDAVATLASRSEWALALLDAIEKGTIQRQDVSVFTARQMQGSKDKRVVEKLAKVWGQIQSPSAQRAALTAKYKAILTEDSLKKADPSKGRSHFVKNCAACHKLYDDGGDIGPPLTGSQRSNLDYILENVLDPSAVVPNEYKMTTVDLLNGRRINGIIKAETDKSLTVRTANETLVIPKDEIEARTPSKISMMPDGILDKLSEQEVRDLVAYLRGREQVPLPKQ
jgi:putative membrane-bound dehydrogenase-like protein